MRFWRWWTVSIVGFLAVAVGEFFFGLHEFLVEHDKTYITFLIGAIATVFSGAIFLNYKRYKTSVPDMLWFMTDAVVTLGMIGTLIGFYIVLTQGLPMVDPNNIETAKEAISVIGQGMGTALITTLAGITASVWMKLQLVLIDKNGS